MQTEFIKNSRIHYFNFIFMNKSCCSIEVGDPGLLTTSDFLFFYSMFDLNNSHIFFVIVILIPKPKVKSFIHWFLPFWRSIFQSKLSNLYFLFFGNMKANLGISDPTYKNTKKRGLLSLK